MADTVDTQVLWPRNLNIGAAVTHPWKRVVVKLTNESDGTGESAVVKVDKSNFLSPGGGAATKFIVDSIDYSIDGFNYVVLEFDDASADAEIAVLKGAGFLDFTGVGGIVDPGASVGDIILTTDGGIDGASYTIVLALRVK